MAAAIEVEEHPANQRRIRQMVLTVKKEFAAERDPSRPLWTDADEKELARLERRAREPQTFDEWVAWQREFGAEEHDENEAWREREGFPPLTPAGRREWLKAYAREFDVPFARVKAAFEDARRLHDAEFARRIRELEDRLMVATERLASRSIPTPSTRLGGAKLL